MRPPRSLRPCCLFTSRPRHILMYIHRPEKLKKSRARPDRVEMITPTGPKVSPEWRLWSSPTFHAPGFGLGRQFIVGGHLKPGGAAAAAVAFSRASSPKPPLLDRLPTWLST